MTPPDPELAETILTLAAERGPAKSICPSEAAKAVGAARGIDWHGLLGAVRREAVRLALDGRIDVLRKGRAVDPKDFRGVYRLRIRV